MSRQTERSEKRKALCRDDTELDQLTRHDQLVKGRAPDSLSSSTTALSSLRSGKTTLSASCLCHPLANNGDRGLPSNASSAFFRTSLAVWLASLASRSSWAANLAAAPGRSITSSDSRLVETESDLRCECRFEAGRCFCVGDGGGPGEDGKRDDDDELAPALNDGDDDDAMNDDGRG